VTGNPTGPDDMPVEEVDATEQNLVEADELAAEGDQAHDADAQAGPEDDLMDGDEHRA
jgi:hypothetical protein